jgi:protein arginine N-methyltransferase 5
MLRRMQRFLAADGISVPASYTSFLAPVSSSKLFNDARSGNFIRGSSAGSGSHTPYVVKMHNHWQLGQSQACFTFSHPRHVNGSTVHCESLRPNDRYVSLRFTVDTSATVHGLGGFFEAVLYGDVLLSINPQTASPKMFSWFPLFFPLSVPVRIRAHSEYSTDAARSAHICVNMWRCSDGNKVICVTLHRVRSEPACMRIYAQVWYEWNVSEPLVTPVQNVGGRTYWIGL